jgi:ribose 5-phosphate isomerase B
MKEKIPIGNDHAGYLYKMELMQLMKTWGYDPIDMGTHSEKSVDYPDYIHPVASSVENGTYKRGIILCGSGNGAAMVANKYPHVRAALCWNGEIAELARLHNDANILSLPARFVSLQDAKEILHLFLNTAFEGGRHQRRVEKISTDIAMGPSK